MPEQKQPIRDTTRLSVELLRQYGILRIESQMFLKWGKNWECDKGLLFIHLYAGYWHNGRGQGGSLGSGGS